MVDKDITVEGLFQVIDEDYELAIPCLMNEEDTFAELLAKSGIKIVDTEQLDSNHETSALWTFLLPNMEEAFSIEIIDSSVDIKVKYNFYLMFKPYQISSAQGKVLLEYLMNLVIYQEAFDMEELMRDILEGKEVKDSSINIISF